MQLIFGLDIASQDVKKPEPGTSLYYVRSFTIKIAELSDIISTWQSKKINCPELDVWLEAIEQQSDRKRFQSDILACRVTFMLGIAFIKT